MLGPVDYALWILTAVVELAALCALVRGGGLRRYPAVFAYMLATFVVTVGRYFIFHKFGYDSAQYAYFYFFSDAFMVIVLFFALIGLYLLTFEEMGVKAHLRLGAVVLLCATALFTFYVVKDAGDSGRIFGKFVVELQQNLYFVALVLTYMLFTAIMKLRETRLRLIQLVAALGVYLSAFAANYALHNFAPGHRYLWAYLPPLMAIVLPLAWGFTFWRVPEEARLATAQVAISPSHR